MSDDWDDMASAIAADEREAIHDGNPTTRRLTEETHRTGFMGEFAFARLCGIMPNTESKDRRGDGGIDFHLPLTYTVDVKTRNYKGHPLDLLVEEGKVIADIYVHAILYDDDRVDLIGWEWGSVIKQLPTVDLGRGVVNHLRDGRTLKSMDSLTKRIARIR